MSRDVEKRHISQRFSDELFSYCSTTESIKIVILFGFRARGDYRSNSDIDLAIHTCNANHSQQNLIEYNIQEMSTHLKLDIVFMDR